MKEESPSTEAQHHQPTEDCDRLPTPTCYRLLSINDIIEVNDEFLEDDAVIWTPLGFDHSWCAGGYWHSALKPMRRISRDNA